MAHGQMAEVRIEFRQGQSDGSGGEKIKGCAAPAEQRLHQIAPEPVNLGRTIAVLFQARWRDDARAEERGQA